MAHVVTAASLATGASLSAGPANATGMRKTVTLGQAAACAAVTTQMVKGARGRWGYMHRLGHGAACSPSSC